MNIIKKSYSFILIMTSIFLIFILHINAKNIHATTNLESNQNYNAQITVLNPGLGAYYDCWSHDDKGNFAYNEESIIAKLGQRLEGNLDIYFAIMDSLNVCNYYYLSFNGYENNNQKEEINNIKNTSNHILLLFSPSYARYSTEKTYKEFHYAMDEFSELYDDTYNIMPKYNLIAHSRGGIINLLYATEHPYNVSKIYSLGSPYNGVSLAYDKTFLQAIGLIDVLNEMCENEGVS